ncbi:MAG: aminotransferase [Actinomycetota bacterium]
MVHEPGQTAGRVGVRLGERGVDLVEVLISPRVGEPAGSFAAPAPEAFDLVVTLGSRWNVHDKAPIAGWIDDELAYLAAADRAGVAVLGVCFGAQCLAAALGGSVAEAPRSQIGWHPLVAHSGPLDGPWFEWHGDALTAPPGAEVLAEDEVGIQGFRLRRNLGQFHPEVGVDHLRWWLDHGGAAALRADGIDPGALLAETERREPDAFARCDRLVDWFLDDVAAVAGAA